MSVIKILVRGETAASFINGASYGLSAQIKLDNDNIDMANLIKIYIAPEGVAFVDLEEVEIVDSSTPLGVTRTIKSKWTSDITGSLKVAIYAETETANEAITGIGDNIKIQTPTVLVFPKANELRVIETGNALLNQKNIDNIEFIKWGNGYVCQPQYFNKVNQGHIITTQYKTDFNGDHQSGIYMYGVDTLVGSLSDSILVNSLNGVFRYESRLNTASLQVGKLYYIKFFGSQGGESVYTGKSEPFILIDDSANKTIDIEYYSDMLAHDIYYTSGIKHKITVSGKFDKLADSNEEEPYIDSSGTLDKINDITTLKRILQVFNLPSYVIQKINIALASDYCEINGVPVKGQDKLPMNFNKYYYSEISEVSVPLRDGQLRNLHV